MFVIFVFFSKSALLHLTVTPYTYWSWKQTENKYKQCLILIQLSYSQSMSDRFYAIGSGLAITIWSKDRAVIGDRKIKDWDRKNAIFLMIVAFCSKYEVNHFKIAGNVKMNFKKALDILLDWRKTYL